MAHSLAARRAGWHGTSGPVAGVPCLTVHNLWQVLLPEWLDRVDEARKAVQVGQTGR